MNARDRLLLEQKARQLREIAEEISRLAPLQAMNVRGVAQALELRTEKLTRDAREVRA